MLIDLEGWVPVAVDGDAVEWRHLPGQRFTEPFFEDTLRRHPPAPVRRITRAEAVEWAARHPGLAPTGFVFHLSRCGSTLVAQMLAAVEENRVTSEPPAADQALAAGDPGLVGAILSALARPNAGETRFFVKFDCWHIHHYALVRRVFPSVPAIFLYRDPLEVLVSQMRNPGMWTVGSGELPRERHVAGLLERILRAALGHAEGLRARRDLLEAAERALAGAEEVVLQQVDAADARDLADARRALHVRDLDVACHPALSRDLARARAHVRAPPEALLARVRLRLVVGLHLLARLHVEERGAHLPLAVERTHERGGRRGAVAAFDRDVDLDGMAVDRHDLVQRGPRGRVVGDANLRDRVRLVLRRRRVRRDAAGEHEQRQRQGASREARHGHDAVQPLDHAEHCCTDGASIACSRH